MYLLLLLFSYFKKTHDVITVEGHWNTWLNRDYFARINSHCEICFKEILDMFWFEIVLDTHAQSLSYLSRLPLTCPLSREAAGWSGREHGIVKRILATKKNTHVKYTSLYQHGTLAVRPTTNLCKHLKNGVFKKMGFFFTSPFSVFGLFPLVRTSMLYYLPLRVFHHQHCRSHSFFTVKQNDLSYKLLRVQSKQLICGARQHLEVTAESVHRNTEVVRSRNIVPKNPHTIDWDVKNCLV